MIELLPHAQGLILPVKAHPGARRSAICGQHAGHLKVSVQAAPEKGKANLAIVNFLCQALHLHKSQIELLSGETSTQKRFLIREIAASELTARISQAISEPPNG